MVWKAQLVPAVPASEPMFVLNVPPFCTRTAAMVRFSVSRPLGPYRPKVSAFRPESGELVPRALKVFELVFDPRTVLPPLTAAFCVAAQVEATLLYSVEARPAAPPRAR